MPEERPEYCYLERAVQSLEEEAKESIVDFLNGKISGAGGFAGLSGDADVYYTFFGVASLSALGVDVHSSVKEYIPGFGSGDGLDFVHLCCLARCVGILGQGWQVRRRVLENIEKYRSADNGYSHISRGAGDGTVYASFLASRAYNDCGAEIPGRDAMLESVERSFKAGGMDMVTTVAAAGMVLVGGQNPELAECIAKRIMGRLDADGGFKASEKAPGPDLLSTAAALYALRVAGVSLSGIVNGCQDFVEMLWCEDGGFAGSVADSAGDVEYTYYGLLALGCLLEQGAR